MTTPYGTAFYADRRIATRHAAERFLTILAEHVPFASVADVGCGTGTWLAAAMRHGATATFGYEGTWVGATELDDDRIRFAQVDLEQPLTGAKVDIVISLEVAEHLSPVRAEGFVADLCAMAPIVLFGAAIPGQGGVNHINEQWQSYWARLFLARGYRPFDLFRPQLWSDAEISPWYRQNALLFVRDPPDIFAGIPATEELGTLDVVHPAFWERANRELGYANAIPESEYLARQARRSNSE